MSMSLMNASVAFSTSGMVAVITLFHEWLERPAEFVSEQSIPLQLTPNIFAYRRLGARSQTPETILTPEESGQVASIANYLGPNLARIDCFYHLLRVQTTQSMQPQHLEAICNALGARAKWVIDLKQPYTPEQLDRFRYTSMYSDDIVEQLFAALRNQ
jgi:hypothetical protein